ncbi:MAG: PAS domain S-box protein [Gemmatimonadaceae bacterium]|nr:PAS domain S-box protein [Gemmatimonadaceae bacterium]
MAADMVPQTELLDALELLSNAEEVVTALNHALIDAVKQLETERGRFQSLFEFAQDPFLVTDEAGVIEEANAAAAHLLGVSARSLLDESVASFVDHHERGAVAARMEGIKSGRGIDRWQLEVRLRDGTAVPVEVTVTTLEERAGGKAALCWLMRDLSARRETQESIHALNRVLNARVAQRTRELELALEGEQSARREAESANRIKSELFARLSHEFRTPLHAVSGYLEILQQNIHGALSAAQRQDVDRIHQAQEHLLMLVNMILDFAKLEGGTVELTLSDIPIDETLRGAESLVIPQFAKKHITYQRLGGDTTLTAYADRERVQQVIVNLLANAVKFTPPGGTVQLEWAVEGDCVLIRVRDTGPGIPQNKLELIFEPFVQLRPAGSVPAGGTGLGLAISRDLARAMSGEVRVASAVDVGSVFTLSLPLRRPLRQGAPPPLSEANPPE